MASYKSVWLARLLTQHGALVDVVMTRAAREFVGSVTFEAVTGRPVSTDLFAAGGALDHIRLAREADVVVVAPATADFLARVAHGLADDLLTAALLAVSAPVLLVPAMNDRMWANAQTVRNVQHLRASGLDVIEPAIGPLAFGEGEGPGRLHEPETIVAHVARLLEPRDALDGRRVLVTAGATREAVDPVRFLSNHSTGRMGVAVATAAWQRGAEVTVIAGHVDVPLPPFLTCVRVEETARMAAAVAAHLPSADVLVMAAAPADFRPVRVATQKIKRGKAAATLELAPTADILRETRRFRRPDAVVVGFALETEDGEAHARAKRRTKALDLVVLNPAGEEGAGFGSDTNRVTLIDRTDESIALPRMPKSDVAHAILDRVAALLPKQHGDSRATRGSRGRGKGHRPSR